MMNISFFKFLVCLLIAILLPGGMLLPTTEISADADVPLPALITLQKAQDFMAKQQAQKALDVLRSFRTNALKNLKAGEKDKKGATHYLIDFHMGNACMMLDRHENAIPHFGATLKKMPDFQAALQNVAICHYELQHHQQAARCFLKAYDTAEKKEARFLYYSAVSFMAAEQFKRSLHTFERLFASHGSEKKTEWIEPYVHACLGAHQNRKALPHIETLIRQSSGEKKTRWQEALLYQYVTLKMKDQSLKYAETLTRQYPLEPKWWKALVHIHLNENHYKEALVALTIYGWITPLTHDEKKRIADLNATLNIPVQAAHYYEELLSETLDPRILKQMIHACLSMQQPEKALKYVRKGLTLSSATTEFQFLKGRILFEMTRYEDAIEAYEKALRQQPSNGDAWLMLGYAALNMEDFYKAKSAFQKALEFPKHHKKARQLLLTLKKQHGYE
jgi:tetratricopeptide (TPR) repeat protein